MYNITVSHGQVTYQCFVGNIQTLSGQLSTAGGRRETYHTVVLTPTTAMYTLQYSVAGVHCQRGDYLTHVFLSHTNCHRTVRRILFENRVKPTFLADTAVHITERCPVTSFRSDVGTFPVSQAGNGTRPNRSTNRKVFASCHNKHLFTVLSLPRHMVQTLGQHVSPYPRRTDEVQCKLLGHHLGYMIYLYSTQSLSVVALKLYEPHQSWV